MPTTTLEERHNAIHQRFNALAQQYSQSEIARKTGAPRNKVNRYVHGTRIPCDFAAALVDELGVNPSWLLTGEGSPSLSDVTPDTVQVAGNLLELIRGMSAVEHMQLGALAGKHHLGVLRELSDALSRLESLRSRLNKHSAPFLRTVLDNLSEALDKPDLNLADDLARTAQQLSRMCDDPDLLLDLTLLQSRLELFNQNLPRALELTRRAILLTFYRGGQLGERELEAAVESVAALHGWHRFEEAHRVARGVFALAAVETRELPAAQWLTAIVADMHILTGRLYDGLKALPEVCGVLTGTRAMHTDLILARGMLLAGTIDVSTALGFGQDSLDKAVRVLGFSVLIEDDKSLTVAYEYWKTLAKKSGARWVGDAAKLLLRAMGGEASKSFAREVRNFLEHDPTEVGVPNYVSPILGAQLYRHMGHKEAAKDMLKTSSRAMGQLPSWLTVGVMWEARHQRNALELGTKAQQKEARKWFQQHIDKGYRCFVPILQ
jgi:hypothetical protein